MELNRNKNPQHSVHNIRRKENNQNGKNKGEIEEKTSKIHGIAPINLDSNKHFNSE